MAGVVEIEKLEMNDVEAASSPHGARRELTTKISWVAHAPPKLYEYTNPLLLCTDTRACVLPSAARPITVRSSYSIRTEYICACTFNITDRP